jgi:hypothetical protein
LGKTKHLGVINCNLSKPEVSKTDQTSKSSTRLPTLDHRGIESKLSEEPKHGGTQPQEGATQVPGDKRIIKS